MTNPTKILLIEDNPGDARLVQELIKDVQEFQFIIDLANNLTQSYEILAKNHYDLILLDLSLPESTGLDTFIQVFKKYPHIPIIILTGNENLSLAIDGVKAGAQDYIFKGKYTGELLVLSIRHAIDRFDLISQIQKNQELLNINEKKYRLILKTIPLGAILINEKNNIQEWNDGAQSLFGWIFDEVIGKNVHSLLFNFENCKEFNIENLFRSTINDDNKKPIVFDLYKNCDKLNKIHLCEWYITPINDPSINFIGYLAIINDITEKRKMEELMWNNQKIETIGNLSRGIAHDFNNVLSIVNGYTELILSSLEQNSPIQEPIQNILTASKHAKGLVDQLFILSKNLPQQILDVDLNKLIQNLYDNVLRSIISQEITIELNLEANIGMIHVDPNQLTQVIMNLIINSRDAIESKAENKRNKKICISTTTFFVDEKFCIEKKMKKTGKYVILEVFDTGIGISSENLSHLFESFFTTKGNKGTGLGLCIVNSIVSQYNGSIIVDSVKNEHTSFKLFFPI